jgi:thioredoxin 1
MSKVGKILIVTVLIAAVVVVLAIKQNRSDRGTTTQDAVVASPQVAGKNRAEQLTGKGLPVLIDLGADKCIPCKMMAPILEELKREYGGRLIVEFIDVWKNPAEAPKYDIKLIPTQIFYDASGKELFRHEGFFSKEDILSKWKELGIEVTKTK